ncbi:hypothetical protein K505DRAFT_295580 [Melanomma pulvis-pyrius CBS 109.77]|uniref:C2H2-type domain-containing protein n=1 Tax=Melanomma pulvis-pyrius CBS 109.77 TaxID=1314802 RepID=A0A6A6XR49_9PLEO|nr:hypothetical protein K505DRAFT_295580 [Melanomma pulvis-pyrius CBS 109.77]
MAMHLASMVHGSGRDHEAHEHHRHLQHQHQHQQLQHQPQPQHASFYAPQPQPRGYAVPAAIAPSPYPPHSQTQTIDYQHQRHPQSPPSPPVEDQKPSLPSISSLLVFADGDKAASETAGQSPKSQHPSPQLRQEVQQRGAPQQPQQLESRFDQVSHAYGPAIVSNPRMTLPPTPPMHPDPVIDGHQSPSIASSHSAVSAPYFLGQSLNNMEPHHQRQNGPQVPPLKRDSLTSQPAMSPFNAPPYAQSPYASSPGAASNQSFYSPETHAYNSVGMYGQRALPSNFQPQSMPLPVPTTSANASGVWQHHHYISTSSQSAFPQSQDRYICSTCNKAFSRPSSLRIHSHSHTGEKPYKCPQPGCGKAFSVRSNMKRHERGCHASSGALSTT